MRVQRAIGAAFLVTGALTLSAAPGYAATSVVEPAFVVESEIREFVDGAGKKSRCSASAATLVPGVTRCLLFRVHNTSTQPITVRTITMSLDSTFPQPPSGCSAENLSLPTFTGLLPVTAGGWAESPGLPIRLENTATNQDNCKQTVLHFVFDGTASGSESQQGDGLAATGAAKLTGALLIGIVMVGLGMMVSGTNRRRTGLKS
ncbi:hypothetical protein [Glaciibacter psychrotolerans]|uniref:hypothetical protein n=1 Tax=Glaciibacter psychrotolerans TaxID=670054 RepID=UPI001C54BEAF|nr:hypothetical protein [Leifsonia psychrotolerans]